MNKYKKHVIIFITLLVLVFVGEVYAIFLFKDSFDLGQINYLKLILSVLAFFFGIFLCIYIISNLVKMIKK